MSQSLLTQLNHKAASIATAALKDASLKIKVAVGDYGGARVLNFAPDGEGTIAAGLKLAEICMGGLGQVKLVPADGDDELPLSRINVSTAHPLLACMASQYAGWPLESEASEKFFAMCSGPARALRGREDVLKKYSLTISTNEATKATEATGVLETKQLPPAAIVEDFANQCSVELKDVTLCLARTASVPGSLQVVARSVETALHKLHELEFDLATIKTGFGSAPLPPIAKDDLTALGWTNDAILYGTTVNLAVETTDEAITNVIQSVPSATSNDFGSPFIDIFNHYDQDFYKIDKMLFSPAQISIYNMATGNTFRSGQIRNDILQASFTNSTPVRPKFTTSHSDGTQR